MKTMNKDKQRIAIAVACGWRNVRMTKNRPFWADDEGQTMYNALGGSPPGEALTYVAEPPDYLNDLNAMREAEENSTIFKSWWATERWLDALEIAVIGRKAESRPDLSFVFRATAEQRAKAFLVALYLWEE